MNPLARFAKDSSCALMVTSAGGGRQLSPIRPHVMKDFAQTQMNWTSFTEAITASGVTPAANLTYIFEFSATPSTGKVRIFGNDVNATIDIYINSDVTLSTYTILIAVRGITETSTGFGRIYKTLSGLEVGKRHVVTVSIFDNADTKQVKAKLDNGEWQLGTTGTPEASYPNTGAPYTHCAKIYRAELWNDTTGTLVWEAYDYEKLAVKNVQYGSVLPVNSSVHNFHRYWNELERQFKTIGTGNYKLEVVADIPSTFAGGMVLQSPEAGNFSVGLMVTGGNVRGATIAGTGGGSVATTPFTGGTYTFTSERSDTQHWSTLNGTEATRITTGTKHNTSTIGVIQSTLATGGFTIRKVKLTSNGTLLYDFPSVEEALGLVTPIGQIGTSEGFTGGTSSIHFQNSVKTGLDLSGATGVLTIGSCFKLPSTSLITTCNMIIFSQGIHNLGDNNLRICWYGDYADGKYVGIKAAINLLSNGTNTIKTITLGPEEVPADAVAVLVIEYNLDTNVATIYLDGALLKTVNFNIVTPSCIAYRRVKGNYTDTLSLLAGGSGNVTYDRAETKEVYGLGVFRKGLTVNEIRCLTSAMLKESDRTKNPVQIPFDL